MNSWIPQRSSVLCTNFNGTAQLACYLFPAFETIFIPKKVVCEEHFEDDTRFCFDDPELVIRYGKTREQTIPWERSSSFGVCGIGRGSRRA